MTPFNRSDRPRPAPDLGQPRSARQGGWQCVRVGGVTVQTGDRLASEPPIRTVPLEAGARSEQGSTWRAPTCEVRRSMNVPAGDSSLSTQVARLAVTGSPERGYGGRVSTQGWQRFRMAPRGWSRGGIGSRRTRTPGGRRDRTHRGSVCAGRRRRCTPSTPAVATVRPLERAVLAAAVGNATAVPSGVMTPITGWWASRRGHQQERKQPPRRVQPGPAVGGPRQWQRRVECLLHARASKATSRLPSRRRARAVRGRAHLRPSGGHGGAPFARAQSPADGVSWWAA